MATNRKFENEEQLASFLSEQHDVSRGRYEILKSVCRYLELEGELEDSEFEEVKDIFHAYIAKRIDDNGGMPLDDEPLNGGSLTGLRSKGLIDDKRQLTEKGFQVLKIVSRHLSYL